MPRKNKKWLLLSALLLVVGSRWVFGFFSFGTDSARSIDYLTVIPRISKAGSIIERHYYDPGRINPEKAMKEGLNFLSIAIPEMLVEFPADSTGRFAVSISGKTKIISYEPPAALSDTLRPIAEVFAFITEAYRGDVKPEDQEYAVINGMLETLDPHSNLLTPDMFKEFRTQTTGEYGGIGIVVGIKDDELTVVAPLEGTPAMRAGIQTDDKIVQIDSLSTTNMPLSEAVERLRGKISSKVTLQINRKNADPREYTLVREQINIESVRSKLVTRDKKRFGVLGIRSFQENTYPDMEKALHAMRAAAPLDGIVLDLRNNPGGLLDQSLEMADKFLERGDILFTVGPNNQDEEISRAGKGDDILDTPMVVLVNHGSASASEIVAGALKNNQRAVVMGSQTFGKGSVQSLFGLKDGASVKLTMAQYLTPGKISIQAVGITPDIELIPAHIEKDAYDLQEDENLGEKGLTEHLENKEFIRQAKSFFKLQYLDPKKTEKGENDYTVKIDETKDYPLALALNLLGSTKAARRPEMLQQALPLLKQETAAQDRNIEAALKKQGVDWTAGAAAPKDSVKLEASSRLLNKKNNQTLSSLQAGEEIIWQLTAGNRGTADLYRVLGVIRSENPLLDNREFVFGRIRPGASQTAQVSFSVPADMFSIEEKTRVEIFTDEPAQIASFRFLTQFLEKPKPILAYSYQIRDDGQQGSQGNGNKIPEKGETVVLNVTVKNRSAYAAKGVIANLKNTEGEGIFLKGGRADLGELAPQASGQASLIFQIDPAFPKDSMKIDLSVADKESKAGFTDTLSFQLNNPTQSALEPAPEILQVAPVITISAKDFKEAGKTFVLSGSVEDDQAIGDVTIFSGDKKVFYKAGGLPSVKTLSFTSSIPLEDGMNLISIQARDNRKFKYQQTLSVIVGEKKRQ